MKLILLFLMLIPVSSIANSEMKLACENLSKIANENSLQYGTKYAFKVQGLKGTRVHFHSAPSKYCVNKNLFIIPNDSVIAYQEFINENQQWFYAKYIDKDGNDHDGWFLQENFKLSGSISTNLTP